MNYNWIESDWNLLHLKVLTSSQRIASIEFNDIHGINSLLIILIMEVKKVCNIFGDKSGLLDYVLYVRKSLDASMSRKNRNKQVLKTFLKSWRSALWHIKKETFLKHTNGLNVSHLRKWLNLSMYSIVNVTLRWLTVQT